MAGYRKVSKRRDGSTKGKDQSVVKTVQSKLEKDRVVGEKSKVVASILQSKKTGLMLKSMPSKKSAESSGSSFAMPSNYMPPNLTVDPRYIPVSEKTKIAGGKHKKSKSDLKCAPQQSPTVPDHHRIPKTSQRDQEPRDGQRRRQHRPTGPENVRHEPVHRSPRPGADDGRHQPVHQSPRAGVDDGRPRPRAHNDHHRPRSPPGTPRRPDEYGGPCRDYPSQYPSPQEQYPPYDGQPYGSTSGIAPPPDSAKCFSKSCIIVTIVLVVLFLIIMIALMVVFLGGKESSK